ncbi:3'(2'),5'-bisphosphate nucleotidase [Buchnera aphidicola (Muscaphis stroyani)]|uniref:3'(2'),5'-bisphosphate nucleotidase CysQ n=1 Tax=Buchnera aphidicola (Muscaphis stroyani) TaxID=1241869 RepID=A0A4D6Y5A1_9GAMM|nr:3'(2'),5'-bisphosphate nucleotidase CysQ [Buchnera aphidicola]QCI24592.1 3'(2'),5'-bisphosphate nucleotidase [Buchnera aphidicola (Muscaphis stroyani)]
MLKHICQLARDAGNHIMKLYFSKKLTYKFYKLDNTPVTNADHEAHEIIYKKLLLITPNIPIVSEEGFYNLKMIKGYKTYWLIDPIDGTKEFLKKNGEFTVNISLIKNGKPTLGVIYVPFSKVLYYSDSKKSWKSINNSYEKEIHVSNSKIPVVVISRSHPDVELNSYLKKLKNYKILKIGSSLKFCLIAEGKAQIYPRFGNTNIWDTAAGSVIVSAAGGQVRTWKGKKLNYLISTSNSFKNSGFCVLSS